MQIAHDGRGNIVQVEDVSSEGNTLTQRYNIDIHNRVLEVEFPGETKLTTKYNDEGRLSQLNIDGKVIDVEFDAHGVLARLRSRGTTWQPAKIQVRSDFEQISPNPRRLMHKDHIPTRQPYYGSIKINDDNLDATVSAIELESVQGLKDAMSSLATLEYWFQDAPKSNFEKPSNAVFQPLEYASTNCCLVCPFVSLCGVLCTNYFGTSDDFTCNCQPINFCTTGDGDCGAPSCSRENSTSKAAARAALVAELVNLPYVNYEFGRAVSCPNSSTISYSSNSRADKANCVPLPSGGDFIYAGHTHPFYTEADVSDQLEIKCYTDDKQGMNKKPMRIYSDADVIRLNNNNTKCSKIDKKYMRDSGLPLLMRLPGSKRIRECTLEEKIQRDFIT